MRIVVAVDDSRHSERAVEFVTQMRWPAGSRMIVVTVVPPAAVVQLPPDGPAVLLSLALESEQAEYLKSIVHKAEQRLRASGFSVESRVLFGDARMALLGVAQDERADLLVLGSHGRTGLARLLIGSVSSHSVTHAPCSVLVVKDTAQVGARSELTDVKHETIPMTKPRKKGSPSMITRRAGFTAVLAVVLTAVTAIQVSRSAAEEAAARSALTFSHSSVLWMEGKSTIHEWESRTNKVLVTFTRDAAVKDPADAAAIQSLVKSSGVRGVDVTIPVMSLKSGKDGLDKNLRKAMKVDKYPNIAFHLGKYTVTELAGDTLVIRSEGTLTVTGNEKPVVLQAKAWRGKEGLWLEGQTPLRMSEYDVHAPSMMLGTLRVDDRLVIHYRLLLTANDADALGTQIERTH